MKPLYTKKDLQNAFEAGREYVRETEVVHFKITRYPKYEDFKTYFRLKFIEPIKRIVK